MLENGLLQVVMPDVQGLTPERLTMAPVFT